MSEKVPYLPDSSIPPQLPRANMLRMWSHSPTTLHPGVPFGIDFGMAVLKSLSLSPLLIQLIALYISQKLKCKYIWDHHLSDAKTSGVSDSQIEALRKGEFGGEGGVWDERERALWEFLDQVVEKGEVDDGVFEGMGRRFGESEIVEVLTAQGFFYMWARIATVLRVQSDGIVEGDQEKAFKFVKEG